ncbi:TetR/AcrR family transcriptional regulator [Peribacillus sp. Hz7]|uniref:TetR/AcrR family transcriptional regulator n=1 Tax=Peribacillus sp. Hz7 TaxID=3344873 RepID=UPI0035CC686B
MQHFTLKAIAQGTGVMQGTIYYHFHTKEQLLLDIVKHIYNESWEVLEKSHYPQEMIPYTLQSAKGRCSSNSMYQELEHIRSLLSNLAKQQKKLK